MTAERIVNPWYREPWPWIVMAGPALVAQTWIVASPLPLVVAAVALRVPRVDAKLTVAPPTAAPALFQLTVTLVFGVQVAVVAIGMNALAAGVENWNCWSLTEIGRDAVAPTAETVKVSAAALVAVSVKDA